MISATNSAAPNEEKPKLADPTKYEVKFSMSALITKVKKPSVNKVNGNEMTIRIGLISIQDRQYETGDHCSHNALNMDHIW